jgi:hypothetical protein
MLQERGTGVFANEDIKKKFGSTAISRLLRRFNIWGTRVVAEYPAKLVVNSVTVQLDERLGDVLKRHLACGNINEAEAVQLWLLMHRAMGQQSPYAPYFRTLPSTFDTPVNFTETEMRMLAGTYVNSAVQVRSRSMSSSFITISMVVSQAILRCACTSIGASERRGLRHELTLAAIELEFETIFLSGSENKAV